MNNIFCIVSAIGNNYGIFSYQQRFEQLLSTIKSIKKYASGSDIVIYDASENLLPEKDVVYLNTLVNQVILLNEDMYIHFLKYNSKDPSPNKFEKKTVGEIQSMLAFLNFLKNHKKRYNRVFKLSGRYELNDNFNLSSYADKTDKCVFLNKENWYDQHVFTMRLWSFDYNRLDDILNVFQTMQKYTYDLVTLTKNFEIVEFTFTKFIEKLQVPYVMVDKIGVYGLMGLNGKLIDE